MSKKEVSCTVTGHSNGLPCRLCGKRMDTLRVETRGHLQGKVAMYCYPCGPKGTQ